MPDSKKLLLVGWDAADWKVIDPLMAAGHMPTVKRLVDEGVRGNITTLSPVLSPMLWTSIATGKRPFKHGIYGFTEPTPDRTAVQPMTNASRRCKAIWNILNQQGMQSNVVGWWPSHPAEPINGTMVSDSYHKSPRRAGQAWDLMPSAVHPRRCFEELRDLRFNPMELTPEQVLPFIPHAAEVDQHSDPRLSQCMRTIAECTSIHAAVTHVMETEPWDFTAVYYDAIDHFCHGFMKFRAPKQAHVSEQEFHLYQHVVTTGYLYHDMMLARLLELSGEDTTVVLLSDHGFQSDHMRPKAIPAEPAGPAHEHREQGILVASGPGIRRGAEVHGATLLDVTPTLLAMLGLPVGADMDGRVLEELFETPPSIQVIPSWEDVPGEDGQHPPDRVTDPVEAKEALEQLIALGYIERPPDDAEAAIAECTRELDYNLARSYMDAALFGEAIPLLSNLYRTYPLEFRFGIQLANCLQAMQRFDDLERLIDDLNGRWRVAREAARKKLAEVATLGRERRDQWRELKKIDEEHADEPDRPRLARLTPSGKPMLFTDAEHHVVRKLKAVARGNPQTLDFLAATVAATRGDHERTLRILAETGLDQVEEPGMLYHVGTMFLEADHLDDAQTRYEAALAVEPLHANAHLGMCRVLIRREDFEGAVAAGERAVGLRSIFPGAYFFLGRAREGLGDHDGAIEAYRTGIAQNPNFPEAHERLAKLLRDVREDHDAAAVHRQAALDLRLQATASGPAPAPIELPQVAVEDVAAELPDLPEDPTSGSTGFVRCLGQAPQRRREEEPTTNGAPAMTPVTIVSGLPRSGTSMMMQMLAAGGLEIFADGKREADENNPKGYYEAETIKKLAHRNDWVRDCGGQCMKVVAPLVPYLPQDVPYRILFMDRAIEEVLGSQDRMLERLDRKGAAIEDAQLAAVYRKQVDFAFNVLRLHAVPVLTVPYAEVVDDPAGTAARVAEFLGGDLDVSAMAGVVDPSLYRERVNPT